jgi:hypothetical protein
MPRCEQCDNEMWQDLEHRWVCLTCVLFQYGHIHHWTDEARPPVPAPPPSRVRFWEFDEPAA